MDDETYNYVAGDRHCGGSPCVLFLGRDPHELLRIISKQARANEAQFLEHLILRAEVIWNYRPPPPPLPRPWWELWRLGGQRSSGDLMKPAAPLSGAAGVVLMLWWACRKTTWELR